MASYMPLFNDVINTFPRDSHKKCKILCEFHISEKCEYEYVREYRDIINTKQRNDGHYICIYCSRKIKFLGRNNPHCKYHFNDDLMESIDTEKKAYFLGWIASGGYLEKNIISISIHKNDVDTLTELRDIICPDIQIKNTSNNLVSLTIYSQKMCDDICKHLNIELGKKSYSVNFPKLSDDNLTYIFLRGYFEGDGCIPNDKNNRSPRCSITSNSNEMLLSIKEFSKIPCNISRNSIEWSGFNCLDFLGKIYDNPSIYLTRKYNKYIEIMNWEPIKCNLMINYFKYVLCSNDALPPIKTKKSDSGWDLTLVKKLKEENNIYYYTTDIKIQPMYGYWFKMVPRSSLCKKGWGLANNVGIIDISYTGLINVALFKINPNANEIELPCKCVQIIPEKLLMFDMIETTESDIDDSIRNNTGGLGSNQFQH